jgi:hypothetical protein
MANTIIITAINSTGGDSVAVAGTVNGVSSNANASRAVLGSFANATNAQSYLAMLLLNSCPQGVSQGALAVTTGTVNN